MTLPLLSIFVITHNESARLPRMLRAIAPLQQEPVCAELIVIDSGSTDSTQGIAEAAGGAFEYREWEGYGSQKSYAESRCSAPWLLNLDADEYLSDQAVKDITNIVQNPNSADVYDLKITVIKDEEKTIFLAPVNWTPRLYRKGKAYFSTDTVLDKVLPIQGANCARLNAPVYHQTIESFPKLWEKLLQYNQQQITKRAILRKYPNPWLVIPNALFFFLKHYFLRRMFALGGYGFAYASILSAARLMRDCELLRLSKIKNRDHHGL